MIWYEMSYNKFANRKNENDYVVEKDGIEYMIEESKVVYYYGNYEDITIKNCFGVENSFQVCYGEV